MQEIQPAQPEADHERIIESWTYMDVHICPGNINDWVVRMVQRDVSGEAGIVKD